MTIEKLNHKKMVELEEENKKLKNENTRLKILIYEYKESIKNIEMVE